MTLARVYTLDPPADLVASLTRSKAQVAAGQTVPMTPFLQRLQESINRVENQQTNKLENRFDFA